MARIGIIGSGNVGANTAFYLAEKGVAHVVLHDIQDGMATGKALDMMEAAPVRGYKTRLRGTNDIAEAISSEVVIIAAGTVREPGKNRDELLGDNRPIIEEVAAKLAGSRAIVLVATEPVDILTAVFVQKSKLDRKRVIGAGGLLDSTRLRYAIAHELGFSPENVSSLVIGRHSPEMIPLASYCSVSGAPLSSLLSRERIEALFEQTKRAGDEIVSLAKRASSYYGPAAALSDLAESIIGDIRRIFSVSMVLQGECGVSGAALSVPAVIGANGVEQVLEPKLSGTEAAALARSAAALNEILKRGAVA